MKKILVLVVMVVFVGFAIADFAYSAPFKFSVAAKTFIGKANACGTGYPAGSDIVGATWEYQFGLEDVTGHNNNGFLLSKIGPTSDCSSAGAVIKYITGITLTELGFDIRNGGHCSAGAPRFNVDASDGFHFMGGCANGTISLNTPAQGWMRVRIDPTDPAQAFPPLSPGATIKSIEIVFDEGTDAGPDFSGFANLDNIDVNGTLVGQP